jgi:hypothetical protein
LSQEILEFKLEYEVGSSQSGSGNIWKIFSEEFEPFYASTDPVNCPIFNYEIYSGVETLQGGIIQLT